MVKKCGPACPEQPEQPTKCMPSIQPVISVSSVNGMTGDVVLKNLIIGEKTYNGSDQKAIDAGDIYRGAESDTNLTKAFAYVKAVATEAAAIELMQDAECGDVCYCTANSKFYLSVGEGEYKNFSDGQGGGEPSEYLKSASVDGNTLTITKKDGSTVVFTVDLSLYRKAADQDLIDAGKQGKLTAGQNITIDENNVISATGGGLVDDVKVDGVSVVTDKVANIDLTGKASTEALAAEVTRATEAEQALDNNKQAKIDDLETIRSGAALGATAVQPAAIADMATKTFVNAELIKKQDKLTAGTNITIDENNVISATCYAAVSGMYIGSVVRDPADPALQRNLIGLSKDPDIIDVSTLYNNGYTNYIADNYSCTCFAFPQSIGALISITMNGTPFEMVSSFNRYDDYVAADGTKFYIYTYNQTVAPQYSYYTLKWK